MSLFDSHLKNKNMYGNILLMAPFVGSSSRETFVRENRWFGGGGRRISTFRDLGPGGQCSGHFPALLHKPYIGQRSARDPQPVPHGGIDPALDISIFEPTGSHSENVRKRENHGELQEAQPNQQAQSAADFPRGPGPRFLWLRTGVVPV